IDFTLPFKRVIVHVQDPAGNPVSNVAVLGGGSQTNMPLGPLTSKGDIDPHTVTTDSDGNSTFWLFPVTDDPYTMTATPPPGSSFGTTAQSVSFTADTVDPIASITLL